MPMLHVALEADPPTSNVVMVGNHKVLGWWDPHKGVHLRWNGKAWETAEPLFFHGLRNRLDYKFVHISERGSTWEDGPIHTLKVPPMSKAGTTPEMALVAIFNCSAATRILQPGEAGCTSRGTQKGKGKGDEGNAQLWRARCRSLAKEMVQLCLREVQDQQQREREEREALECEKALRAALAAAKLDVTDCLSRPAPASRPRPEFQAAPHQPKEHRAEVDCCLAAREAPTPGASARADRHLLRAQPRPSRLSSSVLQQHDRKTLQRPGTPQAVYSPPPSPSPSVSPSRKSSLSSPVRSSQEQRVLALRRPIQTTRSASMLRETVTRAHLSSSIPLGFRARPP